MAILAALGAAADRQAEQQRAPVDLEDRPAIAAMTAGAGCDANRDRGLRGRGGSRVSVGARLGAPIIEAVEADADALGEGEGPGRGLVAAMHAAGTAGRGR